MVIQNNDLGSQIRIATPTTLLNCGTTKKQFAIGQFSMKIVRRTHLYAGLFLAPWVAMYGFSGLIFNHGNWFAPGGGNKPIEWTVDVTALPQWPEPDALARKVVAALNATEKDKAGAAEYRLSAEGAPKLQGGLSLQGQDAAGGSVSLSFDRQERKGTTFHSPPGPPEEQVKLETNDTELLNATKDALLAAAGKSDPKLSATKWTGDGDFPRLSFPVEQGKERRVATYDLRSGLVSLSPAPERRSMRVPDFLTSLHLSHGYPSDKKSEKMTIVRAVFVDAMGLLMCFWAVSGIIMWLQLKHLRRPGLIVAIASLLATVFVWSAMYRFFTG
jgi:hypothetical protein